MKKQKILFTLFFISILIVSGCINTVQKGNKDVNLNKGIEKGYKIIDFSFNNIETNKKMSISDFNGSYVLIGFMATWCTPCKIEATNANKAETELKKKGIELKVVQIGIDLREYKQDLIEFKKNFGQKDWVISFDDGKITKRFNVRSFDTTLIINKEGKIIYRDNGSPASTEIIKNSILNDSSE